MLNIQFPQVQESIIKTSLMLNGSDHGLSRLEHIPLPREPVEATIVLPIEVAENERHHLENATKKLHSI